jgi:hypothetical protein
MITGYPLWRTLISPQHPTRAISTQVVSRKELTVEFQTVKQRKMVASLAMATRLLYWTQACMMCRPQPAGTDFFLYAQAEGDWARTEGDWERMERD